MHVLQLLCNTVIVCEQTPAQAQGLTSFIYRDSLDLSTKELNNYT